MTIITTADLKKKSRVKPAEPKSKEQCTQDKSDMLARKQKLKAGIASAIEAIDRLIKELADEHEITFEKASTLVYLSGHVFKDHQQPSIQNAYQFCLMRVKDGRCQYDIFSTLFFFIVGPYDALGNVDDSPERVEAIRIIQKSRQNGRDYKTVSKVDQGALLALLQESHDVRETGIIGQPQIQLQDIQTMMEKVNMEVCHIQCMHHLP
jgi:hypothetical protein